MKLVSLEWKENEKTPLKRNIKHRVPHTEENNYRYRVKLLIFWADDHLSYQGSDRRLFPSTNPDWIHEASAIGNRRSIFVDHSFIKQWKVGRRIVSNELLEKTHLNED